MSLLATYEQDGKFHLIFHWADTTLLGYWETECPKPTVDLETITWMAEQCRGLCDGLVKIHRHLSWSTNEEECADGTDPSRREIFGTHGDIKPENVLWVRDPENLEDRGTLKLTDFGLAKFNNRKTNLYHRKTGNVVASPSYRSPEFDTDKSLIGPSYDVWALGCVYLEFITWILGGYDLVSDFQQSRKTRDPGWHGITTDTFFVINKEQGTKAGCASLKESVLCVSTSRGPTTNGVG